MEKYSEIVSRVKSKIESHKDDENLLEELEKAKSILREFESWWRLPTNQRTIENIEKAMRDALDFLKL